MSQPTEHAPVVVDALEGLERELPRLMAEHPADVAFWPAFNELARQIKAAAPEADRDYVQGRIDCMLKNVGLIPGEEEGAPCR